MVRRDNVIGVVVGFGMVGYVLLCGSAVAVAAELAGGDEFNGVHALVPLAIVVTPFHRSRGIPMLLKTLIGIPNLLA